MSKGSPVICLRVPPGLHGELLAEVEKVNTHHAKSEISVQGFILEAIKEKIAHRKRSRRTRDRRKASEN